MKLYEYEAKKLFSQHGITVPKGSQLIHCPEQLAFLKVEYPIVIKTQVLSGGRGKAGGIKFASDTTSAMLAAEQLFELPIKGEYPFCLVIDPKVPIAQELYLAVTLDRERKCPILMGSSQGGIEIESSGSVKVVAVAGGEFSPHLARRLAYEMGLSGKDFAVVSTLIEKLFRIYDCYDLDLAEINPLAKLEDGSFVALDGKITINEDSLGRQPQFAGQESAHLNDLSPRERRAALAGLKLVELGEGNIGILCNGAGLTMATMDLVQFKGGKPANFLDVGGGANKDKVHAALQLVATNPKVKVIFVNILGGITACDQVAIPLASFKQNCPNVKLVVRLLGNNQVQARNILEGTGIEFIDDLDTAVAAAVEVASQ